MKRFLLFACFLLASYGVASAKLTVQDLTGSSAAVVQSQKDYDLFLEVFHALQPNTDPLNIKVVIYPAVSRLDVQAKHLPETGLSETYLMPDGSLLIQANPKRGRIIHEFLHAFSYSIKDQQAKEEFFCKVTEFLIDGRSPNTRLVVAGDLKDKINSGGK